MIPAKEIKLLTYQLLENNFIQLQELRKNMSNNAPTKSFYLFYVDLNQVARMVAEMCRKALANSFTRKNFEATQNKRLLEKQVCFNLSKIKLNANFPSALPSHPTKAKCLITAQVFILIIRKKLNLLL